MAGNASHEAIEKSAFATDLGRVVHNFIPHDKVSIYLWTAAFCLGAITYVYLRCRMRGAHGCLEKNWWLAAIVHAAPMALYLLFPLVPLDKDLLEHLAEDQIVIALGGLYAFSVSFGEVRRVARDACDTHQSTPRKQGETLVSYALFEGLAVFAVFCIALGLGSCVWSAFLS